MLGVVDFASQLVSVRIRGADEEGNIHGGFIQDHPRKVCRSGMKLRMHISWLKFLRRKDDIHNSSIAESSDNRNSRARAPDDLLAFIHRNLSGDKTRLDEESLARQSNVSGQFVGRRVPLPKIALVTEAKATSDYEWLKRAKATSSQNRYVDAIARRQTLGLAGRPEFCVCGKFQFECWSAQCLYKLALRKGDNIKFARVERTRNSMERRKARMEKDHKYGLNFDEIDDDLQARIRSLTHDEGRDEQFHSPVVDRQQFRAEDEDLRLRNIVAQRRLQAEAANQHWTCQLCGAINASELSQCSVCRRAREAHVDREAVASGFLTRLENAMNTEDLGKLEFDGREIKAQVDELRKQKMLRKAEEWQRAQVRKKKKRVALTEFDSDNSSDSEEAEISVQQRGGGMVESVKRGVRSKAYMFTRDHLNRKTGTSGLIKTLWGTDFTDAVEQAPLETILRGDKLKYGLLSSDSESSDDSSTGNDSDSSSSDSDSDSDSDE